MAELNIDQQRALALAQARAIGINFLLSVFVLVWAADVAAYFAGRAFGLRLVSVRLAPAISPGKSWEGVWGGMLAVLAVARRRVPWTQGMEAGGDFFTASPARLVCCTA